MLDRQGVWASLKDVIGLVKRRFKDIAVIWLLMIGIGMGWAFIALLVVLPASIIAALLFGVIQSLIRALNKRACGFTRLIQGDP